uniref:G_PROTEIN_RECEP_F1_2 domain-containing protein n=2 Tax=Bursaphelenchus xylophilus TaxID=6326 RepID=A0A1I7RIG4_BURXY
MRAQQMNIYIMAVFYTTVFLISFIGNATVVYVMVIRAKTTNVMNLLITNLAVSDFLVCITSLWLTPLYWYTGQWMWGTTMCHFFPLFQGLSICNSSMTLLVIAVDRYIVVCKNQDSRYKAFNLTTKNCKFVIAFIWSIAITLVMPYALNMKIKKSSNLCGHYKCLESWSTGSTRAVYGLVVTMFQFIIPMIFIGFSYMKIFMFLQRQCQESNNRLRVVSNKKNALFRMLFVMVVAFAVCWLPVNILNVMRDIGLDQLILGRQFGIWFMRAHMLSMTGVMVNPLIYAFMNHNFRDEFCRVFPIRVFIALPKRICRKSPAKKENGLLNVEQNTTGLLTNNTRAITDDGSQKRGLFSYYDDEFDDLGRDDGFWTDEDENQNKLKVNTPRRKRSRFSERTENEMAAATGCCSSFGPKNDEPYAKSLEMQKQEERGKIASATRTTTTGTPTWTEEKNSATVVAISTEPSNPSTEPLSIRRTIETHSTANQHSAPTEFDVHSDVQL